MAVAPTRGCPYTGFNKFMSSEPKILTRDVEAAVVPIGTKVTLQKGESAYITQSLGGSYTVVVNGNMFRIGEADADALGFEVAVRPAITATGTAPMTQEELEKKVWEALKTCYDPEIPVNVVDLGLIYDCHLTPIGENNFKADVKMTLTAPGCGMGPSIASDAQRKILSVSGVTDAQVDVVWDPPWSAERISQEGKSKLGMI